MVSFIKRNEDIDLAELTAHTLRQHRRLFYNRAQGRKLSLNIIDEPLKLIRSGRHSAFLTIGLVSVS